MEDPESQISKLIDFCGISADLNELIGVVRPELYRNRK
jgi:hypothetical protein